MDEIYCMLKMKVFYSVTAHQYISLLWHRHTTSHTSWHGVMIWQHTSRSVCSDTDTTSHTSWHGVTIWQHTSKSVCSDTNPPHHTPLEMVWQWHTTVCCYQQSKTNVSYMKVQVQNKTDGTVPATVSSNNCCNTNTHKLHTLLPDCSVDVSRGSFRMQVDLGM